MLYRYILPCNKFDEKDKWYITIQISITQSKFSNELMVVLPTCILWSISWKNIYDMKIHEISIITSKSKNKLMIVPQNRKFLAMN